jgi:SprT-like family
VQVTELNPTLNDSFFWRYCPNPLLLVDLEQAYAELNETFFNGLLPADAKHKLKWEGRFKNCLGTYNPINRVIKLSKKLAGKRKDIYSVLLHEMLHKFLDLSGEDDGVEGHGPNFISWASAINQRAESLGVDYRIHFLDVEITENPKLVCTDLGITLELTDLDVAVKAKRLAERVFNDDYDYYQ